MKKFFVLFVVFCVVAVHGQQVSSVLDKNTIDLGELTTIRIKANYLEGQKVIAKPENELLPFHFEETKDSISENKDAYYREIEFAVYEEGEFTIPALDFTIGQQTYQTVPYTVTVVNPTKENEQPFDIMNNKEVSLDWRDYWDLYKMYILGGLVLIAIVILLVGLIKYVRRDKDTPKEKTNTTLKLLRDLEKKKYIENGNYRLFYVELIDITRWFVVQQYGIPADVLLTDDLVHVMKQTESMSEVNEKLIEDVIIRGDQVKFAKMLPDEETMRKDMVNMKTFVKNSTKDIELENLRTGV